VRTINPKRQRRNNLAVLARTIWKNPGISRRGLVERFELDESSVSRLVGMLLTCGLIESSCSTGPSDEAGLSSASADPEPPLSGGRPRKALRVRPGFGQAWGLALWRDRVRVSILDAQGEGLAMAELRLQPYDGDWEGYLDRALAFAADLARKTSHGSPLLGIGFGMPGRIDSETGRIIQSFEFGIEEMPCAQGWNPDLPILWENDANCAVISGLDRGESAVEEVLVLGRFLENGPIGLKNELSVGFGLVIGGRLHRGWRHGAGEFKSALWDFHHRYVFGVDEATFADCSNDREAFLDTAGELMRNLLLVSEFMDPRAINLGGDLKERYEDVLEACRRIGWAEAPSILHPLPLEVDEVSRGAALLVLEELFQLPGNGTRRTLFHGYATGEHDPVWLGLPSEEFIAGMRKREIVAQGGYA